MMMFITIALGVFVGTLMAGAAAFMLMFNDRFMTWYTKKALELVERITDELQETFEKSIED